MLTHVEQHESVYDIDGGFRAAAESNHQLSADSEDNKHHQDRLPDRHCSCSLVRFSDVLSNWSVAFTSGLSISVCEHETAGCQDIFQLYFLFFLVTKLD